MNLFPSIYLIAVTVFKIAESRGLSIVKVVNGCGGNVSEGGGDNVHRMSLNAMIHVMISIKRDWEFI